MANKQIKDFPFESTPELTDKALLQKSDNTTVHTTLDQILRSVSGFFDYNDLATQTTPIVVTGGGGFVDLPNDTLGPQTVIAFPPAGVSRVWDPSANQFDWSQLNLGDTIDIRLALEITTSSPNTTVEVDLSLGTGLGSYVVPFILQKDFKSSGTFQINRYNGIYIGDANTKDNGGKFIISSDKNCTIKVLGWYCKIGRR